MLSSACMADGNMDTPQMPRPTSDFSQMLAIQKMQTCLALHHSLHHAPVPRTAGTKDPALLLWWEILHVYPCRAFETCSHPAYSAGQGVTHLAESYR